MAEELTKEQIAQIKKKTEGYKKSVMTVKELHEMFTKFIEEGNGDAMIETDDGFGGSVCIAKNAEITVTDSEIYGKWCNIF